MIPDGEMQRAVALITAQVAGGTDAVIAAERGLFALVAAALAERMAVIRVASPMGPLSLSSLIAQVSGRPDFDGQDDSVLELGFRRLNAPDPTALMLEFPQGASRSALRYIQHVSRQASGLVLVALDSPALDAMLEEPGFATLRARLRAGAPIGPAAVPEPASPLAAFPPAIRLQSTAPRRRPLAWTAAASGVAAAAIIGVWAIPGAAPGVRETAAPVEAVAAPLPPAPTPPVASMLVSPPPESTIPTIKPPAPEPAADAVVPPQRPKPPRVLQARRAPPARFAAPPRPEWEARVAPPPPLPVRRELRGYPPPYLGTYATDAYGMRIFRYDP